MPSQSEYRFADLTLDTGRRRLTRGDEPIELPRLSYSLLVALVEAAPNVLTHDDLVRLVWGGRLTSPETVTQRIKLLRDALADDAEQPRYVGLVRGQGYRLLPQVQRLPEATQPTDGAPFVAADPPLPQGASRRPLTRALPRAALALVAATAIVLAGLVVRDRDSTIETSAAPPAAATSVAVLPFTNDSPDPEQQHFADGLSGELINALSRIPDLAVRGRASSFYFKGKTANLKTIGETLRVSHVLSGSVQRSADRLRVTAELVAVDDGHRLWGNTYERPLDDIFAIQDDITEHVAASLQIALGVGRLGRVPGATRNVAAYEEMLKGGGYLRAFRVESIQPAIEHFVRATQLDESSSAAWMALAEAYAIGAGMIPERALEWRRRASESADRARALTPQALHVLAWEAARSIDRGAWNEAATFLEELTVERFPLLAREYGPNPALWGFKGLFLLQVGRAREAVEHLEQARIAEPLLGSTARFLGDAYADTGALSAALAEFDRGLQLGTDTAALQGYALAAALAAGDRAEIERRLAALWPGPGTDAHLRMARLLDEPAAAAADLRAYLATETAGTDVLTPLVLAHWAGYYEDPHAALALLQRIPRQFFTGDVALALWRPVFGEMRMLPEFNELVRDVGLVDYWRAHGWPDFCTPVADDFTCR